MKTSDITKILGHLIQHQTVSPHAVVIASPQMNTGFFVVDPGAHTLAYYADTHTVFNLPPSILTRLQEYVDSSYSFDIPTPPQPIPNKADFFRGIESAGPLPVRLINADDTAIGLIAIQSAHELMLVHVNDSAISHIFLPHCIIPTLLSPNPDIPLKLVNLDPFKPISNPNLN